MNEKDWAVAEAVRALESAFRTRSDFSNSGSAAARPADNAIRCERVRTVLSMIDDLSGMSPWLQREQLHLWNRCVESLRHIDTVWAAPMIEFDAALWLFKIAFRAARELYRTHLQKPTQGVLEGLQAVHTEEEG